MNVGSSNFDGIVFVLTPKELCHIAQGWERSELPWVPDETVLRTPTGFRHPVSVNDATLSG